MSVKTELQPTVTNLTVMGLDFLKLQVNHLNYKAPNSPSCGNGTINNAKAENPAA